MSNIAEWEVLHFSLHDYPSVGSWVEDYKKKEKKQ